MNDAQKIEILEGALAVLGQNGENWVKDKYNDGRGHYCLAGAVGQAALNTLAVRQNTDFEGDPIFASEYFNLTENQASDFDEMAEAVTEAVSLNGMAGDEGWSSVPDFNDYDETSFEDIKEFVERRIAQLKG